MSVSAAPSSVPSMAPTMSLIAIEKEGMACSRMAATLPGLQSLSGK